MEQVPQIIKKLTQNLERNNIMASKGADVFHGKLHPTPQTLKNNANINHRNDWYQHLVETWMIPAEWHAELADCGGVRR